MKPTNGIEVKTSQNKAGIWKATAKHVDENGDSLEVSRWSKSEPAAQRAAHTDVLNGLRIFGRYADLVARETGRFDL